MLVSERVREDQLCDSRLFSTGRVAIRYLEAWINVGQHCSKLDDLTVEVAAPDEGVRSTHVVGGFEVVLAPPNRRETAVDDAHLLIGVRHKHTEKLEGLLSLTRNQSSDDLVLDDVDAAVLDDGNVVIVGVDGDIHRAFFSRDQVLDPGTGALFESVVEASIPFSERRQAQDIKCVDFERLDDVCFQAALLRLPTLCADLVQTHIDVVEADGEFLCALLEFTKDGPFSSIRLCSIMRSQSRLCSTAGAAMSLPPRHNQERLRNRGCTDF